MLEAPSAPPNPYRFAGTVFYDGALRTFLKMGDRIYEVREGEALDEAYRVERVTRDTVTLLYAPLGIRQTILAAAAPAVRTGGPPALPPGSPLIVLASDPQAAEAPGAAAGAAPRPAPRPALL